MSNEIPVAGTVTVSIPTFTATGTSGASSPKTLTFSAGAPPTDGSLALCFIALDPGVDEFAHGGSQRLAYFRGAAVGNVSGDNNSYKVPGWSFVADASVD